MEKIKNNMITDKLKGLFSKKKNVEIQKENSLKEKPEDEMHPFEEMMLVKPWNNSEETRLQYAEFLKKNVRVGGQQLSDFEIDAILNNKSETKKAVCIQDASISDKS